MSAFCSWTFFKGFTFHTKCKTDSNIFLFKKQFHNPNSCKIKSSWFVVTDFWIPYIKTSLFLLHCILFSQSCFLQWQNSSFPHLLCFTNMRRQGSKRKCFIWLRKQRQNKDVFVIFSSFLGRLEVCVNKYDKRRGNRSCLCFFFCLFQGNIVIMMSLQ